MYEPLVSSSSSSSSFDDVSKKIQETLRIITKAMQVSGGVRYDGILTFFVQCSKKYSKSMYFCIDVIYLYSDEYLISNTFVYKAT